MLGWRVIQLANGWSLKDPMQVLYPDTFLLLKCMASYKTYKHTTQCSNAWFQMHDDLQDWFPNALLMDPPEKQSGVRSDFL
jgi:hypothetical protein